MEAGVITLSDMLAELGGVFVSYFHWKQFSHTRYPCFPADIAASLKLIFFCLRTKNQESWRKVRDLNHGGLFWVAQVRAFLISGFVLSE